MTRNLILTIGALLAVTVIAAAGYYSIGVFPIATTNPSNSGTAQNKLRMHQEAKDLPKIRFNDSGQKELTLADFSGKIVLLNIWATWCGPCRHEMPTLDRLQGELGGDDFEVVALSIDRAGPNVVRKFFDEIGVKHLSLYIDESGKAAHALKAIGLPVTLLLNRKGQEIGRLVGPAEWDAPEMIAFFKTVIKKHRTSQSESSQRATQLSPIHAKEV